MKKILFICVTALLVSCSSGPESAAKNFTENLANGKVENAKKYATKTTGTLLDMAESFGGLPLNPNFKFQKIKDSIDGKKAWITFINAEGEEDVMELVNIEGKWLVQMEPQK